MFGKKKKQKENQMWEAAFLEGVNYALWVLQRQSKNYGDLASIKDLMALIGKGL